MLVIAPEQVKLPVEFATVHPVEPEPPPIRISPVEVLLRFKTPEAPPSKLSAFAPVEETAPAPAKVKAVAEVAIVSIEATPVSAPAVETFSPVELIEKVSKVSPMAIV